MNKCKVSVIVPAYNVESYIDDCMDSIINQSFSDIEILLIVGRSTDKTSIKCKNWEKKDRRIRLINEKEKGLGPARNQGVFEAKGEYIVFVDSDDIIKSTYIEKMYNELLRQKADLVECDFSKIRSYTDSEEYATCTELLGKKFKIADKLLIGNVAMWKIMSRRELWIKNKILQPSGVAEDFATYPLLLFSANKIADVPEDLYLYKKDSVRDRNIDYTVLYHHISEAMIFILEECRKRNYFNRYLKEIDNYIRRWISRYCSPCLGRMNEMQYMEMKKKYVDIYKTYFDCEIILNGILWGSFNLSRIVNKLSIIEDPYNRINFISMISIMSKKSGEFICTHKNRYREFMLMREYNWDFFEYLEKYKPSYFFFDLLEERHDIMQINEMYFTKSDVFDEAIVNFDTFVKIIRRQTLECQQLWEESCVAFFEKLFRYIEPEKVIMIESFLMEKYGDGTNINYFENIVEIKNMNIILKNYYEFIKNKFPKIQVVEETNIEYYYTDIHYEFGCYPWHMNEWANMQIADKILV